MSDFIKASYRMFPDTTPQHVPDSFGLETFEVATAVDGGFTVVRYNVAYSPCVADESTFSAEAYLTSYIHHIHATSPLMASNGTQLMAVEYLELDEIPECLTFILIDKDDEYYEEWEEGAKERLSDHVAEQKEKLQGASDTFEWGEGPALTTGVEC